MLQRLIFVGLAALTGCASTVGTAPEYPHISPRFPSSPAEAMPLVWEYSDALLPYEPLPRCSPTDRQLKLADLAVTAIELGEGLNSISLDIGAEEYLALNPCLGPDMLQRVGAALERRRALSKMRLVEYQLHLASRVPPSDYIFEAVANSAFNPVPQQSELFPNQDIRPLARTILARSFRSRVGRYGQTAYAEISAENALGTSAAQIAAAAAYPGTLERIASLMEATLAKVPRGASWMPFPTHKRLIELMWGFVPAGEAGKPYLDKFCPVMRRFAIIGGSPDCLTPARDAAGV